MNKKVINGGITDIDVIERIINGEKELYEILMRRYNQMLYRTIKGYLTDEYEVEDAMQNTYLIAYEKLYQFKATSTFSTWLIRIGINEALKRLNERKKMSITYSIHAINNDEQIINIADTGLETPDKKIINTEMRNILEEAVNRLPNKYRVVYILREVEGLSVKQVAACLNMEESNIKVRLHRAKAMLKDILYKVSQPKDMFEFGDKRCDRLVIGVLSKIKDTKTD